MQSKEGLNINQTARTTGLSASWTFETLKLLEKQGYLISIKLGNAVFFRVNWNDLKTQKLIELIIVEDKLQINLPQTNYKIVEKKEEVTKVEVLKESFYQRQNNPISSSFSYGTQTQKGNFSYGSNIQQGSIGYGIAPAGSAGVSSVLGMYASSGAFGSVGYSGSNENAAEGRLHTEMKVPPDTLGSRVSRNVNSFSLKDHTSTHIERSVSGCKYCGPAIVVQ